MSPLSEVSLRAIAALALIALMTASMAQSGSQQVHHTVFAAQAGTEADERDMRGGATAIFTLSGAADNPQLNYELTYNDIALKQPWRIVIRNSGAGGIGEVVHVVCGEEGVHACSETPSGKLTGSWGSADERKFTSDMSFELTSQRLYLSLEAKSEDDSILRGQILTSPLMIMPVTRVLSIGKPEASGEALGTGVIYLTEMPNGTITADYALTVTGLSSAILGIDLGGVKEGKLVGFGVSLAGDGETVRAKRGGTGITVSGVKMVSGDVARNLKDTMRTADPTPGSLLVRTEKAPEGELLSVLGVPQHQ